MKTEINFILNGKKVNIEADPEIRLLDLLRNEFGLKGTKEGCGEGECGACTIILDGKAVNSCLIFAGQINGSKIDTIEGLSKENGEIHPIQSAFIEVGAVQCGFCTPGMVMSAKALLDEIPNPSDSEIRNSIAGNLCRCTGYKKIEEAIKLAAAGIGGETT